MTERPERLETGVYYVITESYRQGETGICVSVRRGSFGKEWGVIKLGGDEVVVRASGLRRER